MDDLHHKSFVLAYFLHVNWFCLSEAAILGGRPKRVSEEDVSARFLFYEIGLPILSDTILYMESFRRRYDS